MENCGGVTADVKNFWTFFKFMLKIFWKMLSISQILILNSSFRKLFRTPLVPFQHKRFVANKFAISSPVTAESISFRELLLLCEALWLKKWSGECWVHLPPPRMSSMKRHSSAFVLRWTNSQNEALFLLAYFCFLTSIYSPINNGSISSSNFTHNKLFSSFSHLTTFPLRGARRVGWHSCL